MEKVIALHWLKQMKNNCDKAKRYNDPDRKNKSRALEVAINLLEKEGNSALDMLKI